MFIKQKIEIMISKIILNVDEELSPAIIEYNEEEQEYIINIPNDITMSKLVKLVDEIKRITEWED